MTKFYMGRKEVTVLRDAHKGDYGYNAAKERMVVVQVAGQSQQVVPFASLRVVKDEPAETATTRRRRSR